MSTYPGNIDPDEVAKFDSIAARWWDPGSEFKPLHDINPVRLAYIDEHAKISNKSVIDIGCGGGILAESMAAERAMVTGVDMSEASLAVARLHLKESGADVRYTLDSAENHARNQAGSYDVVTCMELLEHVPDPVSLVSACTALVKPGGHVFFSTINRNAKAYLMAIIGAEYLVRMLPKGTHHYEKFIRPSELSAWARSAGLTINDISGISYNPLSQRFSLSRNIDVNYIVHAVSIK